MTDIFPNTNREFLRIFLFPGAWPDHPGVQGGRDGGGRVGERRGHAGHPDEARPGED